MQNKKKNNSEYDNTINEILNPKDLHQSDQQQLISKRTNHSKSNLSQIQSKKFSKWLDISIRILAAIITIALLILFALNISSR